MIVICKSCKKNMNTKIVEDSFWCGHCENYFCYECCQDIEEIEVIEDGVKIMMPSVHKKAEEVCASLFFEASDESLDNIVKRWSGEKNDPYFIIAKKLLNAQISIQSELEKVEVILKKEKYIKNYLKKSDLALINLFYKLKNTMVKILISHTFLAKLQTHIWILANIKLQKFII